MDSFNQVRIALQNWISNVPWLNKLMPYHMYLAFGSLGYEFFYQIYNDIFPYIGILGYIDTIAYFAFFLGAILMLASPNMHYVPYLFWGRVLLILYPFTYFSVSTLIYIAVYGYIGYAAFKYSALETHEATDAT